MLLEDNLLAYPPVLGSEKALQCVFEFRSGFMSCGGWLDLGTCQTIL